MDFELLDRYLLRGEPPKREVVDALLNDPAPPPAARAYLEGMRTLGPRTPDLALMALRLTLAGKSADDAAVVRLRAIVERARRGGADGDAAGQAYHSELE